MFQKPGRYRLLREKSRGLYLELVENSYDGDRWMAAQSRPTIVW